VEKDGRKPNIRKKYNNNYLVNNIYTKDNNDIRGLSEIMHNNNNISLITNTIIWCFNCGWGLAHKFNYLFGT